MKLKLPLMNGVNASTSPDALTDATRVQLKRRVIVDVRPVDAELQFEPIAEAICAEQREADIAVERDGRSAIELDVVAVLIKKVDTELPTFAA